jgi:hypothetical protein
VSGSGLEVSLGFVSGSAFMVSRFRTHVRFRARVGFMVWSESRGSCWSRCSRLVGSGLGVHVGLVTGRFRARVGSGAHRVCDFGLVSGSGLGVGLWVRVGFGIWGW